ncbi:MAG: hypothetical protein R3275_11800 [Saprospiraceae bacterium]|nr:hypothetical protein [Saprospiraceae bacterium]
MNGLLKLGRYLFAIPMAVFGINHLTDAGTMAGYAPFGGEVIIYITGIALILAAISLIIGKYDKLAAFLLGIFLLLTALTVWLPAVMGGAMEQMPNILKDLALAGGAWGFALHAKDDSVIG